jgi:amino acid adenylation domain-containing protein/non-ribosomal peptide synthase protein (TIGR01720 family)
MGNLINKNAEQFWLRQFSAETEGYIFPWLDGSSVEEYEEVILFPIEDASGIMEICRNSSEALLAYFTAGLALTMHRYMHVKDLVICTIIRGEIIPLKFDIDPHSSYRSLLSQAGGLLKDAISHADYSFDEFLNKWKLRHKKDPDPVFRKMLIAFEPASGNIPGIDGFEGCIWVSRDDGRLQLYFEFDVPSYLKDVADGFTDSFYRILRNARSNLDMALSDIDILSVSTKRKLLEIFNPAGVMPPLGQDGSGVVDTTGTAYTDLFASQVRKTPHRRALIHKDEQLTYAALAGRAGGIARQLLDRGIGRKDIVAILLGILQSGAAFLPIDPDYPEERIRYILTDSKACCVLSSEKYRARLLGGDEWICMEDIPLRDTAGKNNYRLAHDIDNRIPQLHGADLAYVIYTSGTTGLPNGVMIEHHSLVSLCRWHNGYYKLSKDDISTKYAGFGFDATIWEIFPVLLSGGGLYIIEDEIRYNLQALQASYLRHGVTVSFLPTPLGEQFMQTRVNAGSLKKLLVGGDKLKQLDEEADYEIYNNYGPTENTVVATAGRVRKNLGNIPIGHPIAGVRAYILSPGGEQLQPIGVNGELCIAGAGLARGYLGKPGLTEQKFRTDPFVPGERMYRTGDYARWLPDGNLEFLGRIDNQVKIRGYRIELGEIEKNLFEHPQIDNVIVVKKEDVNKNSYICAYYTGSDAIAGNELPAFLSRKLPAYMIPALFVRLSAIPVNANGKADRSLLIGREEDPGQNRNAYRAPENEVEETLISVWTDVLGDQRIGTEDNFFVVGGDSIKAIQIQSRLRSRGYVLKTRDIFTHPEIRKLATLVTGKKQVALPLIFNGKAPLTPIQAYFFNNDRITNKSHFNQALILVFDHPLNEALVATIFRTLWSHHEGLRTVFGRDGKNIFQQINPEESNASPEVYMIPPDRDAANFIREKCNQIQASFSLEEGPLMKWILFQEPDTARLAMIAHHLIIDGVSWRIVLEDWTQIYEHLAHGGPEPRLLRTSPFGLFAGKMMEYGQSGKLADQLGYWENIDKEQKGRFLDYRVGKDSNNFVKDSITLDIQFGREDTDLLLYGINHAYGTEINHVLLAALAWSIHRIYGPEKFVIWLEGHGREEIFDDIDINRTTGWFTSIFPVLLAIPDYSDPGKIIAATKDQLNSIPNKGIEYGILRYLSGSLENQYSDSREIVFNYLGQFDSDTASQPFRLENDLVGHLTDPGNQRDYEIGITGLIRNHCLQVSFDYNPLRINDVSTVQFADCYKASMREILHHCSGIGERIFTPGDFMYPFLPFNIIQELTTAHAVSDIYTLSPAQEGMLFHNMMDRKSSMYYEQISYGISAALEPAVLEKAFGLLIDRHDILRTFFYFKNIPRPVQVVLKRRSPEFRYMDISGFTPEEISDRIGRFKEEDRARGFDTTSDCLCRLAVCKTGISRYQFIWSYHHILMDGWCLGIIKSEFYSLYRRLTENRETHLIPAKPYKDYIQWLESRDKKETRAFWMSRLDGFGMITPVSPANAGDGNTNTIYEHAHEILTLTPEQTLGLQTCSVSAQVTVSTLLESVWAVMLGRYTHCTDVMFGKMVSGRPAEIDGIETMVGLFINTIPLRISFSQETSFQDLVQSIQQQAISSEPHHFYSLSDIRKDTRSGNKLFDHIFGFENYPYEEDDIKKDASGSWHIRDVAVFEQTNYDFNIVVAPGPVMTITFKYNRLAFEPGYVRGIKDAFSHVISQIGINPQIAVKDIELVDISTRRQLLDVFNAPQGVLAIRPVSRGTDNSRMQGDAEVSTIRITYTDLFSRQVQQTPHRRALIHKDEQLTYLALAARADVITRELLSRGIGRADIVAIISDRSTDMIAGLLGILQSGAAFLPIDPDYPEERIHYILSDSKARCVLSIRKYRNKLHGGDEWICMEEIPLQSTDAQFPVLHGEDLAYVIYTSGTTGLPNGVMIEHHSLVSLCQWHNKYYNLCEEDVSTKYAGFGFDATIWEIFPVLLSGGGLYIIEDEIRYNLQALQTNYVRHGVTVSFLPTPLGEQFMQTGKIVGSLKKLLVGGDKLKQLDEKAEYEIYNNYGPTENTVVATAGRVWKNINNISIGQPITGVRAYILSPGGEQLQPPGVGGELCIAGKGLARGYLGKPGLTEQKFRADPFMPGERMYRTGDVARWLPDGNLEFLGRIDSQVKIRGFRIELGEIESCLTSHEAVPEAAVLVKTNSNGSGVLVAFYTSNPEPALTPEDLKIFLYGKLPAHMVPTHLFPLDELPVNHNGKVDRQALTQLSQTMEREKTNERPVSITQTTIADVWSRVLGLDQVGVHDNFFDLGGTSLDMIRVNDTLGTVFKSGDLVMHMFKYPTIHSLSSFLDGGHAAPEERPAGETQKEVKEINDIRQRQREKRNQKNRQV